MTVSDAVPGWLLPQAARITYRMLLEVRPGPVMEIGVFRGKYLAVMRGAMGGLCRIVGYDIFIYGQADTVEHELSNAFGPGDIALFATDSTKLTPKRVLEDCGGAPVFISVDGSHDGPCVLLDMELCDAVLREDGIVAMDDFLNPLTLGVNEALGQFMSETRGDLVPFLYVSNKLFLCRSAAARDMRAMAERLLDDRLPDPLFAFYANRKTQNEAVVSSYFGHKVLIGSG